MPNTAPTVLAVLGALIGASAFGVNLQQRLADRHRDSRNQRSSVLDLTQVHGSRSPIRPTSWPTRFARSFTTAKLGPCYVFLAEPGVCAINLASQTKWSRAITQSVDLALYSSICGRFGRGPIRERQSGRLQSIELRVGKKTRTRDESNTFSCFQRKAVATLRRDLDDDLAA